MLPETAIPESTAIPTATILLVEDNPSLLNGICDLLEVNDLGYELRILTAGNGQVGLQLMAEHEPDLIISDIMMPKMDGFQFLKHVRQHTEWIHIPFIFLTAKGKEKDIVEGRLSGAELYITKPFKSQELLELAQTQLNRAFTLRQARKEDMDDLKQNILQIINHEFRTPLTYVTAYFEMLESSVGNDEDQDDFEMYLLGIQAGCIRLSHLVEDLIAIVTLRSGEGLLLFQSRSHHFRDGARRFRQVVENSAAVAASAGVNLQIHIPDIEFDLYGDPEALENVVHRLIDNAIKFTRAKMDGEKSVHVALEAMGEELRLTITDSGIGFPPHVTEKLFEPFYQYNRSHFEQQGSGSGLTIARANVEMHGGRLEGKGVEDQGSRFTLTLPMSTKAVHKPQFDTSGDSRTQTATILIVEDDKYLLEGLREILELDERAYSFDVYTAVNGQRALNTLAEIRPDLIISDIMMPKMGGYELLEQVRQNPEWVKIPFIFLTARGERDERHKGLRSGVAEYIAKPYDSDYLVDMVVTLLNRHFAMEGVVDHSFHELKQSILTLLQPEFRQPLETVNTQSERLVGELQSAENDEELGESLRRIQSSSRDLTHMVEDFITLAEIRTGQVTRSSRNQPLIIGDPTAVLVEAKMAHEMKAMQVPIPIRLQPASLTNSIECYLTHLVDTIRRLIDIATNLGLEHGVEPGGQITLSAVESETAVYFEVALVGATLPPSIFEKITPFFTLTNSGVLDLPVHGMGLTIIAEIIRLHKGQITLDPLQDGFVFTMTLPAA